MAAGDPGSPARYYSSTAVETSLQSAIPAQSSGQSNTSFIVVSISGFPTNFPYTLIVDPDTSKEEVLTVTSGSSTTLTVTRGGDGTAAVAHSAGAVVRHGVSGRDFREAENHIAARGFDIDQAILDAANQTHVHGITTGEGVVVGTAKTQTLTNKTYSAGTFTGSFTASSATFVSPTISGSPVITGLSSAGMSSSSAAPKSYVDAILVLQEASAASAAISATSAATSATSAATSASSALTSANSAATSASSAATSASSALTSANSAATSATSAATSASSAAVSAASAAAAATTSIQTSLIDAKGDLIVGSANDVAARLGVGTDGFILTAASTTTLGLQWAAAPVSLPSQTGFNGYFLTTNGTTASWGIAIAPSQFSAKGVILVGIGAGDFLAQSVGTNGQVLTADSAQTTGVRWSSVTTDATPTVFLLMGA